MTGFVPLVREEESFSMPLNVVELEYNVPPATGPIFAVPIGTIDQALDIFKWASGAAGFTCTLTAKLDGTETVQIEGVSTSTVVATVGGDQWIVYDNGKFTLFSTSTEALAIYKVKAP